MRVERLSLLDDRKREVLDALFTDGESRHQIDWRRATISFNSRWCPRSYKAIVLFRRIHCRLANITFWLLVHELTHDAQYERYGSFQFLLRYGWEAVQGRLGDANGLEIEANTVANQAQALLRG